MFEEKNLSKEFKETMDDTKALLLSTVLDGAMSGMDKSSLDNSLKAWQLLNRLMNLSCDMFEKQDKLMDKMDKVMDKYLEGKNFKE